MKTGLQKRIVILAPVWFGLIIFLAGLLTPGYKHSSQAISELGAPGAPYALVVNFAGFVPLGCSLMMLAFAPGRFFGSQIQKTIATVLFGLTGLAIVVAGLFPTDPGGRRDTLAGMIHAVAGISLLIVASLTPLVMGALPAQGKKAAIFRLASLATGAVLMALFFLTPNGLLPGLIEFQRNALGGIFPVWYKYYGVHQRAFMGIYFVWLVGFTQLFLEEAR